MMSRSQKDAVPSSSVTIDGAGGRHLELSTFDAETTFKTIDCWIYEGSAGNSLIEGTVTAAGIDEWLQTLVPSRDGQQPLAGLRLIVGHQIPDQKAPLKGLVRDAELQSLIDTIMGSSGGVTARLCSDGFDRGKNFPLDP